MGPGSSESRLRVSPVASEDTGTVTCTAANSYGKDSLVIEVLVEGEIHIYIILYIYI